MPALVRPDPSGASPAEAAAPREPGGARPPWQPVAAPDGVDDPSADYALQTIEVGEQRFLSELFEAFSCPVLHAWVERGRPDAGFDRVRSNGLVTLLAECEGRTVAIAWSDFRVRAGSYGRANSRRFATFLRYLGARPEPIPLVFVVQSAGLSLMEGRTAFSSVFGVWPELLRYSEERVVLTCAQGRCLGLAPILYGLGHYRVAVANGTQINLTGPEVIRLFFGEGEDFDARAAAERSVECHDLVHEVVPSVGEALALFRRLLAPGASETAWPELDLRTAPLLASIVDAPPSEVVPGMCPRLRLFVGTRGGRPLGVFVNPLGRSNNMITTRTLDKYAAGLDLFRALRLPVVTVLDSPGIDPRFEQSDAGLIRKILGVGERIIHYPYGTLGVVAGRCFGGATTLGFPKAFGGTRVVALRGAQVGVMHERIVDQVLRGSPRLLAQWRGVAGAQRPDLSDLLAEGSLDAVIDRSELPGEIDRFLQRAAPRPPRPPRLVGASGDATRRGRGR